MQLSKGNRKMEHGFLIWNLPEKQTCPGSTAICREKCYACKASAMYKSVKPSRDRNYQDSLNKDFTVNMITLIEKTVKGYKAFNGYFRIHESGDFYSQKYLDSWKAIAYRFPSINFLAFTKSFMLNFKGCPANLKIVASIMPDTKLTPITGKPKAYAGDCLNMTKTIECPGLCDNCMMCWNLDTLKRNVHFNMH